MEIIDFVKLNFANAEAAIRAYDTKSQIVLAATALSLSPIFFSVKQIDSGPGVNIRLGVMVVLFAIVMLMFLRVLAPVSGATVKDAPKRKSLFFLADPSDFAPEAYVEALKAADLELEYANEILILYKIRAVKNARFRQALGALVAYFSILLLYGFAIVLKLV